MKISLNKAQNTLVFTEREYDNFGIETASLIGFKGIDPEFDPTDVLEHANTMTWDIGEANEVGISEVSVAEEVAA